MQKKFKYKYSQLNILKVMQIVDGWEINGEHMHNQIQIYLGQ